MQECTTLAASGGHAAAGRSVEHSVVDRAIELDDALLERVAGGWPGRPDAYLAPWVGWAERTVVW